MSLTSRMIDSFKRCISKSGREEKQQGTSASPAVKSVERRRISKALALLVVGVSLTKSGLVWAASRIIQGVRLWRSPDKTRLVFDVSGGVSHSELTLNNPARLVIDVKNARLDAPLKELALKGTPIKQIRHAVRNGSDLRVVLDLNAKVSSKSFLLTPNATYGHRLVVDLFDQNVPIKPATRQQPVGQRDIVVAIDAGHGGEDPGAVGPGRVYEKDVVLAIARELEALLKREKGFRPVLVRSGDYYIDLRSRTRKAREHNADLFISIHADGFTDPRANGASVFALSRRGATSETARWLAEKENAADQIGGEGGISLNDKDDMLAGVLLDLSMTSTLSSSLEVGDKILRNISTINRLHKSNVEQAAFVVLKSPDIPSILIETGFITNPGEARKLRTRNHQQAMARKIHRGLRDWFYKRPPPDTLIASLKNTGQLKMRPDSYVIRPGDTLSEIATQFDISTSQLQRVNNLSSANNIRVGQTLVIPN